MSDRILASGKSASKWVLFEKRFVLPDYDNPKEPSRIRWRLFHCPYFGIYLHKWLKPDPRETPHNHPWPFFSLILWGGYEEILFGCPSPRAYRRWINIVPRHVFHTVFDVRVPTWSLMFVGRDRGEWGYLDERRENYIPFDEHPHNEEFKLAIAKATPPS